MNEAGGGTATQNAPPPAAKKEIERYKVKPRNSDANGGEAQAGGGGSKGDKGRQRTRSKGRGGRKGEKGGEDKGSGKEKGKGRGRGRGDERDHRGDESVGSEEGNWRNRTKSQPHNTSRTRTNSRTRKPSGGRGKGKGGKDTGELRVTKDVASGNRHVQVNDGGVVAPGREDDGAGSGEWSVQGRSAKKKEGKQHRDRSTSKGKGKGSKGKGDKGEDKGEGKGTRESKGEKGSRSRSAKGGRGNKDKSKGRGKGAGPRYARKVSENSNDGSINDGSTDGKNETVTHTPQPTWADAAAKMEQSASVSNGIAAAAPLGFDALIAMGEEDGASVATTTVDKSKPLRARATTWEVPPAVGTAAVPGGAAAVAAAGGGAPPTAGVAPPVLMMRQRTFDPESGEATTGGGSNNSDPSASSTDTSTPLETTATPPAETATVTAPPVASPAEETSAVDRVEEATSNATAITATAGGVVMPAAVAPAPVPAVAPVGEPVSEPVAEATQRPQQAAMEAVTEVVEGEGTPTESGGGGDDTSTAAASGEGEGTPKTVPETETEASSSIMRTGSTSSTRWGDDAADESDSDDEKYAHLPTADPTPEAVYEDPGSYHAYPDRGGKGYGGGKGKNGGGKGKGKSYAHFNSPSGVPLKKAGAQWQKPGMLQGGLQLGANRGSSSFGRSSSHGGHSNDAPFYKGGKGGTTGGGELRRSGSVGYHGDRDRDAGGSRPRAASQKKISPQEAVRKRIMEESVQLITDMKQWIVDTTLEEDVVAELNEKLQELEEAMDHKAENSELDRIGMAIREIKEYQEESSGSDDSDSD